MNKWMAVTLAVLACGIVHAQGSGGQGGGDTGGTGDACPDQKATDIAEKQTTSGATATCGIGFVLLGVGGGIIGAECPEVKLTYPAHQKCTGESLEGHKCVVEKPLKVLREECKCGGLLIPWIEVGIPAKCQCTATETPSTIEDFQTQEC